MRKLIKTITASVILQEKRKHRLSAKRLSR